jgi:hypothetical protein
VTPSPPASPGPLERLQSELRLRCYSPRTAEIYRRHARLFLDSLGEPPERASDERVRAYFVGLVEHGNASRAQLNQAVSAVKFLYRRTSGFPWTATSK